MKTNLENYSVVELTETEKISINGGSFFGFSSEIITTTGQILEDKTHGTQDISTLCKLPATP